MPSYELNFDRNYGKQTILKNWKSTIESLIWEETRYQKETYRFELYEDITKKTQWIPLLHPKKIPLLNTHLIYNVQFDKHCCLTSNQHAISYVLPMPNQSARHSS